MFGGAEFTVEAKIGVIEEDTGMEEARAADSKLIKRSPTTTTTTTTTGRGGSRKEISGDGRERCKARRFAAN